MRLRVINVLRVLSLFSLSYGPVSVAATNEMAGNWDSINLSGNLDKFSPALKDFHWQILEQTRQRDDSSNGFRFSENLLFGQLGYSINQNASVWVGYVHDWIHPLDKLAYQENRPYEDFLWNSSLGDLKFTGRLRLEQRIRQDTGDVGVRARELVQVNYPLRFIHKDLSAYVGDEVMEYVNDNTFGRTGFTENRALAGVGFQFTKQLGADLGYLGQYVQSKTGNNLFTHNVQFNVRYQF
ncbi:MULTISPECIES: DUF2490 domain-containing protein [Methylomonas]|uniref:DUF2490 domain-containing protein n=2 Tax=Methylomonas TaxID=416 RepID=A0A126T4M2_9GAMM|nr:MULTISPECIES: DUF2490 domain-containing protein [Methylomonas]AMK77041.1 hypothetical protein JT25_011170 [Methylomonas denitrificans]OAH96249.1 hypothetical protein A1342_21990 [Methylomonas methanica]TCV76904.1 uncharacterized protein DUF2490 [Methylomonas methanica]